MQFLINHLNKWNSKHFERIIRLNLLINDMVEVD